jgi:hypothetical protein
MGKHETDGGPQAGDIQIGDWLATWSRGDALKWDCPGARHKALTGWLLERQHFIFGEKL